MNVETLQILIRMYILFRQMPIAAANDRCDNPRDKNLAYFEESETFLSIEICQTCLFCNAGSRDFMSDEWGILN